MKNRIFCTASLLECPFIDEFFQNWMQISVKKIDSVDIVCFLLCNRISCTLLLPVSNDSRYAEKNMFFASNFDGCFHLLGGMGINKKNISEIFIRKLFSPKASSIVPDICFVLILFQ